MIVSIGDNLLNEELWPQERRLVRRDSFYVGGQISPEQELYVRLSDSCNPPTLLASSVLDPRPVTMAYETSRAYGTLSQKPMDSRLLSMETARAGGIPNLP